MITEHNETEVTSSTGRRMVRRAASTARRVARTIKSPLRRTRRPSMPTAPAFVGPDGSLFWVLEKGNDLAVLVENRHGHALVDLAGAQDQRPDVVVSEVEATAATGAEPVVHDARDDEAGSPHAARREPQAGVADATSNGAGSGAAATATGETTASAE